MRRIMMVTVVSLLSMVAFALAASLASAAEPWWHLSSGSRPTNLAPGSEGEIFLTAENIGDAGIDGAKTPVTVTDALPAGLEPLAIEGGSTGGANLMQPLTCSLSKLSCVYDREAEPPSPQGLFREHALEPFMQLEVRIKVKVLPGASSSEANRVSVSGGGAPPASISRTLHISEEPTPYGVEDYDFRAEEEGGALD